MVTEMNEDQALDYVKGFAESSIKKTQIADAAVVLSVSVKSLRKRVGELEHKIGELRLVLEGGGSSGR